MNEERPILCIKCHGLEELEALIEDSKNIPVLYQVMQQTRHLPPHKQAEIVMRFRIEKAKQAKLAEQKK
jgi:hypothetical protein